MAFPIIEANVSFGGLELTLDGPLNTLTHVRGWHVPCSYIIAEVSNPHTELLNEFMNFSTITIKYGKDGEYVGPITMEIVSVENEVEFSNVKVRIVAVEPGWLRLCERTNIRSFPNQTVAQSMGTLASEAGLQTIGIKQTQGNYTFLQTNVTDYQFMTNQLLPLATDSARNAPYQMTIDNNILHLRPPNLTTRPGFEFIIDPSNETVVKRFSPVNAGMLTDFTYGNQYLTYGYDFVKKGCISHDQSLRSSNEFNMNRFTYESNFNKIQTYPYPEEWMIRAHNRNSIARGQFVIAAEAVITGEAEFFFDQIFQFTMEAFQKQQTEYTGKYYVQGVTNILKTRLFLSELRLHSNAFLKGERTTGSRALQGNANVNAQTGGTVGG